MPNALINPNIKHLRIFVEIARRGSFRSASQTLHLSEPATSQAMGQLESLLSVKLLERTTRSVRLTEAGTEFLADAERILDSLDHSVAMLREFASSGRGRVTLACLSSTVYRLLPPALNDMKRLYPNINVVFKDDNMRGILQSLDTGECDLAIVSEDGQDKKLISLPLVIDAFQVVCPAGHPLSRKKRITGTDLSAHKLVLLRRGSGIRDLFDRCMERSQLSATVTHETTQIHTLLGLVESGLGPTVLPAMLCPPASHANVVVLPLNRPSITRRLGLAFPPGKEPSFAARALASVIQKTVQGEGLRIPAGVKKLCMPECEAASDSA